MTKEEIIELAVEAGFDEHHAKFDLRIESFAKLVASAEREACVKVCEQLGKSHDEFNLTWTQATAKVFANAIRERGQE